MIASWVRHQLFHLTIHRDRYTKNSMPPCVDVLVCQSFCQKNRAQDLSSPPARGDAIVKGFVSEDEASNLESCMQVTTVKWHPALVMSIRHGLRDPLVMYVAIPATKHSRPL